MRPPSPLSRFTPGLRGRLLLAFIAISLFVVVAAAAGLYALCEVERSLDRITLETLPVALDARELLRKSEKIVAIGPALVNASNSEEAEALTSRVRDEQADLSTILARLSDANLDPGALDEISDATAHLNNNLDLMWVAWSDGVGATDHQRRAISEVLSAYRQFGNVWRPRFADLNTRIVRLQLAMNSASTGLAARRAAHDQFNQAMAALLALDKIQGEAGSAFELISRAANASDTTEIDQLEPQAQRSIRALDGLVSDVDLDISSELFKPLNGLRSAVTGEASIFSWVRKGMAAKAESRRLVRENQAVSVRLKMAVDKLVAFSRKEIASANTEAARVQAVGQKVLFAVAALSLACSFLIVWLYVGRNIVSRLTRLSSGMALIAGGERDLIIDTRGSDEVSAMGRAVEVFRQHAIERDALLAERAEAAARLERLVEERTSDLKELLEYQTATSDVLKVISRSTFDLSPVLEYVVETAIRLCRAHMGSIFRLEDGIYRWAVGYGLDPAYREIEERNPITPGTGTLVGRVALEGRALQIADALSDPDYAVKDEAQLTRARTMLGVPLLREGAPVGVIAMARDRVEPFSDKEIALVTTFADQAVIAIENARLLTEQREALEQQTATAEVLRVISGSATDLQPVFEAITERAAKLCEAEFSAVARFEEVCSALWQ